MRIIDADKLPEHKFTRESAKGSDYMRGWNDAIDAIIDNAPNEAIKWIEEKIDDKDYEWPSEECRQDHEQLLGWLQELKGLRLENEVILRRLKHLLESDYISQFDQVDPNTKEYIRNIKEADRRVMYLCDQEKPCKESCKKDHHCKRTSDISHAKNFKLVPNGMYPIIYEEVDEHCIASFLFNRKQLEKIVEEQVIEPIKNGELVVKKERPQGEWIEEIIEELESRMDYGQEYAQAMEDVIVILKAKFGIDMEAENE
jgi:hypothetical protein